MIFEFAGLLDPDRKYEYAGFRPGIMELGCGTALAGCVQRYQYFKQDGDALEVYGKQPEGETLPPLSPVMVYDRMPNFRNTWFDDARPIGCLVSAEIASHNDNGKNWLEQYVLIKVSFPHPEPFSRLLVDMRNIEKPIMWVA